MTTAIAFRLYVESDSQRPWRNRLNAELFFLPSPIFHLRFHFSSNAQLRASGTRIPRNFVVGRHNHFIVYQLERHVRLAKKVSFHFPVQTAATHVVLHHAVFDAVV